MSTTPSFANIVKKHTPVKQKIYVDVKKHHFRGDIVASVGTANKTTQQVILKVNTQEVQNVGGNYTRMLNYKLQPILKKDKKVKQVRYSETRHDGAHMCSIILKVNTKEVKNVGGTYT